MKFPRPFLVGAALQNVYKATMFYLSVLEQKNCNERGRKKHLRKKTLNLFLEKLMRVTK